MIAFILGFIDLVAGALILLSAQSAAPNQMLFGVVAVILLLKTAYDGVKRDVFAGVFGLASAAILILAMAGFQIHFAVAIPVAAIMAIKGFAKILGILTS